MTREQLRAELRLYLWAAVFPFAFVVLVVAL